MRIKVSDLKKVINYLESKSLEEILVSSENQILSFKVTEFDNSIIFIEAPKKAISSDIEGE